VKCTMLRDSVRVRARACVCVYWIHYAIYYIHYTRYDEDTPPYDRCIILFSVMRVS